jgi:hypothetical protein
LKLSDDEKYAIYGVFDGLNFLFGLADHKTLQVIINQELFEVLLNLSTLDVNELELFNKSETTNEFY